MTIYTVRFTPLGVSAPDGGAGPSGSHARGVKPGVRADGTDDPPAPRVHRHRYHGVLAPNAKLRAAVTCIGRSVPETHAADLTSPTSTSPRPPLSLDAEPARPTNPARVLWAVLLARIYEVLPLLCPACGGPMRIVSFITDPPGVIAILQHLELPHTPPPISPARGPPQGDFLLDQTPAFDPSEAERTEGAVPNPRVRIRPVPAPRVRRLKRLVPLPYPTA